MAGGVAGQWSVWMAIWISSSQAQNDMSSSNDFDCEILCKKAED